MYLLQVHDLQVKLTEEAANAEQLAHEAMSALDERDGLWTSSQKLQSELEEAKNELANAQRGVNGQGNEPLEGGRRTPYEALSQRLADREAQLAAALETVKPASKLTEHAMLEERQALQEQVENISHQQKAYSGSEAMSGLLPHGSGLTTTLRGGAFLADDNSLKVLQLETDIANAKAREAGLTRELAVMRTDMQELQSRLDEAVETCKETMEVAEFQEATIATLEEEAAAADNNQKAAAEAAAQAAQEKVRKVKQELEECTGVKEELAAMLDEQIAEVERLAEEVSSSAACLNRSKDTVTLLEQQLAEKVRDLEAAGHEREQMAQQAEAQADAAQTRSEELKMQLVKVESLQLAVGALESKHAKGVEALKDSQAAVVALEQDLQTAKCTIEDQTATIAELTSQRSQLQHEKDVICAAVNTATSQVSHLPGEHLPVGTNFKSHAILLVPFCSLLPSDCSLALLHL